MIINTILVFYAIKKLDADSSKQVRRGERASAAVPNFQSSGSSNSFGRGRDEGGRTWRS